MQGGGDLPNGTASIKGVPGTSKQLPNGTAVIKQEQSSSTQRLPSFGSGRDLSLSSFQPKTVVLPNNVQSKRKVYLPRIGVQRNKTQENAFIVKQEPKETKPKASAERGRGRGRKNNLYQTSTGVFSDGFAPSLRSSRCGRYNAGGGGDGPSEKGTLQKPKLSKQGDIKVDKKEEDMLLSELLRDDFIDDPSLDPDYDDCPVMLPLHKSNIFSVNNIKKIKTEPGVNNQAEFKGEIKIKTEPGLEDDVEGKLTEIKLNDLKNPTEDTMPKTLTIPEVMKSKETQYVMLQLPTCLPGLKPEGESAVRQNQSTSSLTNSSSNGVNSNSNSSSTEQGSSAKVIGSEPQCTLKSLKPGKIGKLQVLKSGRVRLILGETKLWLDMGTQVSFKQDLVAVNLDKNTRTGKTICLGPVPLRMTVTPDWEHLISPQTAS